MVADDLTASSPGQEGVSQTERVVVTLRGMVLRGDFRPGERLAELSLVPVLNASRTPVRLALERLSHQGLLEALPSGGFRVREFTVADIWDAIEIRGVLEGTAARFAAERLSGRDDLNEIRRSVEALHAMEPADLEVFARYVEENAKFHRELWRLAQSPTLTRALEAVSSFPFAEPGALVFGESQSAAEIHSRYGLLAAEQHRAIVEAIENREGTRAESLAREHSRMARRNLEWALTNQDVLRQLPGASLIARSDWPG
ncbi:MAG: GntR family transcriptional regulator [Bryobacteraceae bacterium]